MARGFRASFPFNVPMRLMVPTETSVKGVTKQVFPNVEDCPLFFGAFRTCCGTESTVNNVYTVEATGVIDTWYNPEIKSNCRIYLCDTGEQYEITATPENIQRRNQYLQIRVRKVGNG